jgi:hypothetical protein
MKLNRTLTIGLFSLLLAVVAPAQANEDWSFSAELYLLAADVDIDTAGGQSFTAEFDDIIDDLEFGFFGSFAAKRDKLALIANVFYVDVEASESNTRGPVWPFPATRASSWSDTWTSRKVLATESRTLSGPVP